LPSTSGYSIFSNEIAKPTVDFHHLDVAHAGQTKTIAKRLLAMVFDIVINFFVK